MEVADGIVGLWLGTDQERVTPSAATLSGALRALGSGAGRRVSEKLSSVSEIRGSTSIETGSASDSGSSVHMLASADHDGAAVSLRGAGWSEV